MWFFKQRFIYRSSLHLIGCMGAANSSAHSRRRWIILKNGSLLLRKQFMSSRRKLNRSREIDATDLYSLKFATLWSALKAEHLSLWMLCIYFFFEYVRPQKEFPVIDVLPWGQVFLIGAIVTAFLDPTARWVSNVQNKLLVLFAIIVVLSSMLAFSPAKSLDRWDVFTNWFIVYFLVITVVNTEKRMILFMLAYCLFNLKMSQHGAVVWSSRGFTFAGYGISGPSGWFRNSGEYAIQMLIFGSLAISFVYALNEYWGKYKKWFFYVAAATGYMAVMGASSRGAQIGLLVIGVWWILKLKGGLRSLITICLVGAVLFYILPDAQMQRFNEMGDDKSSLQRLAYWKYGLFEVVPKYPVLGVGYGNWLTYVSFMVPQGMGPYMTVQGAHNIYIQAAAELGITGLISFLLLIVGAFVTNVRSRTIAKSMGNKFMYYLSYGLDAGLIGYLVAGSFVTVLYYPFFWIQISMIVMLNNVINHASKKDNVELNSL